MHGETGENLVNQGAHPVPGVDRHRRSNGATHSLLALASSEYGPISRVDGLVTRQVCEMLEREYGSPRHGNPTDPLEVLVYILLSNRTGRIVAQRTYAELRARFPEWSAVSSASTKSLANLLRPAGLSKKRAVQLKEILAQIHADFGEFSLRYLSDWTTPLAEAYLCGLAGVSEKVAKCVLLYGFDRRVLPVDVHVHRIGQRLGWHGHKRADQSHASMETIVPPQWRYSFHVNCVAHGRAVCLKSKPRCTECVIARWCRIGNDAIAFRPVQK